VNQFAEYVAQVRQATHELAGHSLTLERYSCQFVSNLCLNRP
jgi:hypothetical protein